MDGTMDASMKEERLEIDGIPVLIRGEAAEKAFLMIHGQGGLVPWKAVPELESVMRWAHCRWKSVALRAVSIGVWLGMLACAGVSEERLRCERIIRTAAGEELSWQYYEYARQHSARVWRQPCEILHAEHDALTAPVAVEEIAAASGGLLTVMEAGEHWSHTPEQTAFMHRWEERALARLEVSA